MKVELKSFISKKVVSIFPIMTYDWEYKTFSIGWIFWELQFDFRKSNLIKYFFAFVLVVAAYALFDIGYHLHSHARSLLVKGCAGGLLMITGKYYLKDYQ